MIKIMPFFSIVFLLFLAIVFIVYYLVPSKYKYIWLLLASYYFYASWSIKYTIVLLLVTLITFLAAKQMTGERKKLCLWSTISVVLIILCLFKFWEFWAQGISTIFGVTDQTTGGLISLVAPIGLSFYILVTIGYIVDVYNGKIECETNVVRYALFISFFPTIISGPIERSTNLLAQMKKNEIEFSYEVVKRGLLLIYWGFFLKLLIANRLAIIVDQVFNDYHNQTGATLMVILFFYSLQLYADFAGYSCISIGIGYVFGFSLITNFRQPYFARSIGEFWKRWHISFSSWLRDYIYIPLGGNRKGKVREIVNLIITFFISGIWHGTGMQFIVWGMLHGIYQVVFRILDFIKVYCNDKIVAWSNCGIYKFFKILVTYGLVCFAWLFFRAPSIRDALQICKIVITNFQFRRTIVDKLYLGEFNKWQFYILLIELIILFIVDFLHERGTSISQWISKQKKVFRWVIYVSIGLFLVIGIIRDYGLEASTFIYTQF